jgi:ketosteroid isomerase-like protein
MSKGLTATLRRAENAWLTAVRLKDRETVARLWAGGVGFLDEGGMLSVPGFLKSFAGEQVEMLKTSKARVVRLDRNCALITYTLVQKGSFEGTAFPRKVYATTTWVKRRGGWRAVLHQESVPAHS